MSDGPWKTPGARLFGLVVGVFVAGAGVYLVIDSGNPVWLSLLQVAAGVAVVVSVVRAWISARRPTRPR